MSSNLWWSLAKEKQNLARDDIIPPLNRSDTVAFSNKEKVQKLASHFSNKMKVTQPGSFVAPEPVFVLLFYVTESHVNTRLSPLDTSKAEGLHGISPLVLRRCYVELSPLCATLFTATLFTICMQQGYLPHL